MIVNVWDWKNNIKAGALSTRHLHSHTITNEAVKQLYIHPGIWTMDTPSGSKAAAMAAWRPGSFAARLLGS
jgi:hypothetical protein